MAHTQVNLTIIGGQMDTNYKIINKPPPKARLGRAQERSCVCERERDSVLCILS